MSSNAVESPMSDTNLYRASLVPETEVELDFWVPASINKPEETSDDVEEEIDNLLQSMNPENPVPTSLPEVVTDNKPEEIIEETVEEVTVEKTDKTDLVSEKGSVGKSDSEENKTDEEDKASLVESKEPEEIIFTAKTPSGKVFNLSMHAESTILEVKNTLAKLSDSYIIASEMNLIFKGKALKKANKTLAECGISKGDRIHMIKTLLGRQNSDLKRGKKVGPSIEVTESRDRGFMTITIPQGARAGSRLVISPPGRDNMVVYVPRGHRAGDPLRIQLPTEDGSSRPAPPAASSRRNRANRSSRNAAAPAATGNISGVPNTPASAKIVVMKAKCPVDVTPGGELEVNVPGRTGIYKVAVPLSCVPGEYFYFRVLPNL